MTEKEKAKAYDKALKKASIAHKDEDKHLKATLERIFPELKEDDTERIRKWIIDDIRYNMNNEPLNNSEYKKKAEKAIVWLEKQRDKDKLIQELGEYKVKYTQEVLEKYINSMSNKDDERLRKTAIAFLKDLAEQGYENAVECIDWLEKQGEQKPCMVQWKGDNLKEVIGFTGKDKNFEKWFKSFEEYEKYVHEHNDIFKLFNENGSHYEIPVGAWIIKNPDGYNIAFNAVLKQKPTDKIESRFKVGDWIISSVLGTARIIGVNDSNEYQLEYIDSEQKFSSIDYVNYAYDKWTIQDAKDGDVLAFSNDTIVIFKDLYNSTSFHSYCHIEDGIFDLNKDEVPDWWNSKGFKPATKEQRDLLFQKIREAGYKWNDETKTLEKLVEHKFDPKTLKPFDKVLVRDSHNAVWSCKWFSHIMDMSKFYKYATTGCLYRYCIPYNDDTKHLVGTTDDAPDYYKYWED